MSLHTDEFVFVRMRELRDFFQARLGKFWMRRLRRAHATRLGFQEFYNRNCPSILQLRRLERFAVTLGWSPSPFERKSVPKMLRTLTAISAQVRLSTEDPLNLTRLCAITYHKKRARLLRDDVLSEEWRTLWCQEQRTSNPVLPEPAPERITPRLAIDALLAEEVQSAIAPATAAPVALPSAQAVGAQPLAEVDTPTGGKEGRQVSLSGSRAIKNLSREELCKAIYRALDQLEEGSKDYPPATMHALSRIARKVEGILLKHESPEPVR